MIRLAAWTTLALAAVAAGPAVPVRLYVASESGDIVTQLLWDGAVLRRAVVVPVGLLPTDVDGPHHVALAPDGRAWYVTLAHGAPFGSLWKYAVGPDTLLGRASLELFPTTIALTPDGELAFVANSDFHGDHPRTNVVTVVHTPTMTALTHLPACDMPHGVRANGAGTRIYVSCMHSDEILEIDRATLRIVRRRAMGAAGTATAAGPECSPTFVSVSPDDRRLYVACYQGNALRVLDAATLGLLREIPTGAGAYNVEPSPDGRWVLVTNKRARSVSVIDARALVERARVATSKALPHGIAFTPDGRYAFVTVESVGADDGAVDVLDLRRSARVASAAVPRQPTGIARLAAP